MRYQRLHIRIPTSGKVTLSSARQVRIVAEAINISAGGLCISAPPRLLNDEEEYQIEIVTSDRGKVCFSGLPVYQRDDGVGFQISSIDYLNLKKIHQLVEDFQLTEDFIKHIDEHDIIREWFVDEAGDDLAVSFETVPDEDKHHGEPER